MSQSAIITREDALEVQLFNHTAGLRNEVLRINQRSAFEIIELCSVPSPAGEQQDGWLSL